VRLEQSFDVAAPLERVWQALIDVEQVAPCLPGAAVTGRNDDGSYNGTFTIKIGPTTAAYTGKLVMEGVDDQAHTATLQAQGSDKRGQGGAKATIVSTVAAAEDGGTRVHVATDYHITGRLARFGRGGMIEDISERLLREFAGRLQSSLAGEPDAAEPEPRDEPAPIEQTPPPIEQTPPPIEQTPPPTDAPASAEPNAPRPPRPAAPVAAAPAPENEPLQANALVGRILLDRIRGNPLPWVGVLVLLLIRRRRRRRRRAVADE
jgi:carbon monoxide dehydrogenase subunit G